MSTAPTKRFTPREYLALERTAEYKCEYFNGEIFAMAGASPEHNGVSRNLIARIDEQLRETPCQVFGGDMRVKIPTTGLYTYPDVTIVCGEPLYEIVEDIKTLLNPKVLFEILSGSTEAYDRGKKFEHYRQIPSLTEYVLVSQTEPLVEKYVRQADGQWVFTEIKGLEAVAQLETVPCRLPLRDVYFKVSFTTT